MENIKKFKKARESSANLEKIALELLGTQPNNLKIKWNNRFSSTAGRCRYYINEDRYVIDISSKLYSNLWNFPEESREYKELAESFIDTIIHELAHYRQCEKYRVMNHDKTFIEEAKQLGGSGRRYYTNRESYLFGKTGKQIDEYSVG